VNILLLVSLILLWWFPGLVSANLVWNRLPNKRGDVRYEWGPFVAFGLIALSATGPIFSYFHLSKVAADRIEESSARKQVREAMEDERNKLRVEYADKLLKEVNSDKWGDTHDLDTPME